MRTIPSIVAGLATLALMAGSATGAVAQSPSAPPSSVAPLVGEDWSFLTGKLFFDGQWMGGQETHVENGLLVGIGGGFRGQTVRTDDPRMSGEQTIVFNSFMLMADITDPDSETLKSFTAAVATIENTDGTWTCRLVEDAGWCEGSGAYAGLRAYIAESGAEDAADNSVGISGFITSGDGPPFPEVPAT